MDLSDNTFDITALIVLSKVLRNNQASLESVNLNYIEMGNEGMSLLSKVFQPQAPQKSTSSSNKPVDSDDEEEESKKKIPFQWFFQLKELYLSGNEITDRVASQLSKSLLTKINLEYAKRIYLSIYQSINHSFLPTQLLITLSFPFYSIVIMFPQTSSFG